ncbi:chromosome partitioning protein ParA [Pedobacter yulinensis]|uniref:Chromosome partitioning protein ParA n=1 Tax=Pedobacter yulinensis TaxID=2126353 RepID=A0A2T3HRH2_9SPHI|nr:7TM diverse intracellular signaling domain-containing protein [Pedobacter yulinensis]PST84987.1 chromosome partitioning protein ParA [Pedobacter yulinensis]
MKGNVGIGQRCCLLFSFLLLLCNFLQAAQVPVQVNDQRPQHIISYGEIWQLEDATGKLGINDMLRPVHGERFRPSTSFTPKAHNINSWYWYKFKIRHHADSKKNWILEFFDQTIDDIQLYVTDGSSVLKSRRLGDSYRFTHRDYRHKNFTVELPNEKTEELTYYVRIKSSQSASIIVVLRNVKWFVQYALDEYLFFGLFYGMVIVFSLYNLMMYVAVRQRQYLYYVLYNLSIGFYEMTIDGVAFQYLWPDTPSLNQYSYGLALYLTSVFALLFTQNFLYLRSKAPRFHLALTVIIVLRSAYFIASFFYPVLFNAKFVEIVPLVAAFSAGVYVLQRGYNPARFFVAGYSFLLAGFIIKILILLNVSWLPYGPLTHYSLSFCFVAEMILVSFAIGDNIRHLRKKKDLAQKRVIEQLQVNEKLTNTLNKELSSLVEQRTGEIVAQAEIIKSQNATLSDMNSRLLEQAEEISRMNVLLEKDNQELQQNIEKVSRARVMSQDVDFEEFSKIYPDRDTCFKYLAELKWANGYECRRCHHTHYLSGQLPHSRRCSKCRYEESVIAHTIFQNSRIPINKAFYMLFLVYTSKGKISSHKLSEILSIRQSTCWSYGSKMKKIMESKKRSLKNAGDKGWSKLVFEEMSD